MCFFIAIFGWAVLSWTLFFLFDLSLLLWLLLLLFSRSTELCVILFYPHQNSKPWLTHTDSDSDSESKSLYSLRMICECKSFAGTKMCKNVVHFYVQGSSWNRCWYLTRSCLRTSDVWPRQVQFMNVEKQLLPIQRWRRQQATEKEKDFASCARERERARGREGRRENDPTN